MASERPEYGLTGNPERDGYLTIEQQRELESIQDRTAASLLDALTNRTDKLFPMAAMATGIGKGRIIHKVIAETKRQNPKAKILVIAGTKQSLVQQTHQSLASHQEMDLENLNNSEDSYIDSEDDDELIPETLDIGDDLFTEQTLLYTTGTYGQENVDVEAVTIQKIQSEYRRGKLNPSKYDLVIVDEVHNIGTPARLASLSGFSSVIGFTATAYRHTGNIKTPEEYGFKIVESLPLPDAQEMGFLPSLIGMQLDTTSLVPEVPLTSKGKISYTALEKILKESPELRPYITERLSHILRTENEVYKSVIAVNYVWEAKEIAQLMKQYGFRVGIAVNKQATKEHHTEEIPAIDTIRRYKLPSSDPNSLDILISPYVASEGFDAPATEVVVWASPTDSPVRYTQYTGRLARRALGKRYGVIVDCLYQTQQYNYSYNMAMWMKGNVRQLDNGLLYLGPERNIEELGQLVSQTHFATENRHKTPLEISDLITEPIIPIQPGETAISTDYILTTFIGDSRKLKPFADQALEAIREYYPDLYPTRLSGGNRVRTFTDPEKFIEVMADLGAKRLEGYLPVQPGETAITADYLNNNFIGGTVILRPFSKRALELLTAEVPHLIIYRISYSRRIPALNDFGLSRFNEIMVSLGAKIQEGYLPLQPKETSIDVRYLTHTFIGAGKTLKPVSKKALEILSKECPNCVIQRKNRARRLQAINETGLHRFNEIMINLGAKLKGKPLLLQPGETALNNDYLDSTFSGGRDKLRPLANQALKLITEYYPDYYTTRLLNKQRVDATVDPHKFTEVMQDLGAKLRNP